MGYFIYDLFRSSSQILPKKMRKADSVSLIYDEIGNRKYLTDSERKAFLDATTRLPPQPKIFCKLLAYTGARISELTVLTADRIDLDAQVIVLESLKKRKRGVFRAIPIPRHLLIEADNILRLQSTRASGIRIDRSLWGFSRTTAWKHVKKAMSLAGVKGPAASPKGLRHTFAISALQAGVPITLVRKWLGHSRIETTAIYADVVGEEEQRIAQRLWDVLGEPPKNDQF